MVLAVSLYSYHARELLACWFLFGLIFLALMLVTLGSVVASYAARNVFRWVSITVGAKPIAVLDPSDFHLKIASDDLKLK